MKVCVAQTRPVKGDIQYNIDNHKKLIDLAISNGAEAIIFPELSLTGYEPSLAKELATSLNDSRFDELQKISDSKNILIGAGMPLKSDPGIMISMIIFQPRIPRQTYSKQYLHVDEDPYFVKAPQQEFLIETNNKIAMSICYELSIPEHPANAYKNGAKIYIASVAKSAAGIKKAVKTLSGIAAQYSMTVLMSNCVGPNDDFEGAGKTSIWNNKGLLLAQLDDINEGIIIFDTDTAELIKAI